MKAGTFLKVGFALVATCSLGIVTFLLIMTLETAPAVAIESALTTDDLDYIKTWIKKNDPRRLQKGEIRNVRISERNLDFLIQYLLSYRQLSEKVRVCVEFYPDTAILQLSIVIPVGTTSLFVNIFAPFYKSSDEIILSGITFGKLALPGFMIQPLTDFAMRRFQHRQEYQIMSEISQTILGYQIDEGSLNVIFQWRPDVVGRARAIDSDLLVKKEDKERFDAYNEVLITVSREIEERKISVTGFMQHMFILARERAKQGGHADEENRAVILTLAMYVIGIDVSKFGSIGSEVKNTTHQQPEAKSLTLIGRIDLAKHFLLSAAIASATDSDLANLVDVFKEVDDSRGGTGFSFADLAADQAGVRLSEVATGSLTSAAWLQNEISNVLVEADIMPKIDALPEGFSELEFKRRFGEVNSESYRLINNEIGGRINDCRLLQN